MEPNEYQCYACRGIFEKGWTDEERDAEYARDFGHLPLAAERIEVCDDCYHDIMQEQDDSPK